MFETTNQYICIYIYIGMTENGVYLPKWKMVT